MRADFRKRARGPHPRNLCEVGNRKIFIRFAKATDAERLVRDGVLTATSSERIGLWLGEQQYGRRALVLAEDTTGLLGIVHLVFKLPAGYEDLEAANGSDIAMIEGLHVRGDAPIEVGNQLVTEAQRLAQKKHVTTLTFCLPMNQPRAIAQARNWGLQEFRIMPEPTKILAFFRKSIGEVTLPR